MTLDRPDLARRLTVVPYPQRIPTVLSVEEVSLLLRAATAPKYNAAFAAAPPSTKNKTQARDPEMHQIKKGSQWHFGMKAHIGVDVASGVVHTLTGTATNEADINQMAALFHGQEEAVFADAGYTRASKRPELADRDVSWNIAIKRSIIKALSKALRGVSGADGAGAGAGAGLGRASLPRHQEPIPAQEAALPRTSKEHRATAHPVPLANLVTVKKAHRLGDAYVRAAANFCSGWT